MNKFKIIAVLYLTLACLPSSLCAQHTLTIEINDLKNNAGQVLLEFDNENGEKISGEIQKPANNKCVIVIKNLKPGKYAFKYFHDENKNEKLDTNWLGIPKEAFGFSNNANGVFGPPSLEKTIFELKGNTSMKCSPKSY
jgi:uncharacterized protein (DUF2141 family)